MKSAIKKPQKKAATAASLKVQPLTSKLAFPVVGIGASAGGLEALELFLQNVPEASGLAIVIVQHLDPTRQGIISELLQRITSMKVVQVKDRTTIRPNNVYVIPPNKDMSILHGVLHLLVPTEPRGLRLPIDFFLRALAQDQKENSIGVILSGMGKDGTLGLRAIKENAGFALVQEPESAKFDGMPRSAIEAGLADIVVPASELPRAILSYLQRPPLITKSAASLEDKAQNTLDKIIILLQAHTRHDFSLYKHNTLYRRIERRMGLHQIGKMATYVRFLQENPQELDLLFKELLIGVTSFFRDPTAWEQLAESPALLSLLTSKPDGQALRVWVPGCSTGEEAYSLAIVLKEVSDSITPRKKFTIQVFATDLDRDAIEKARQGFFAESISSALSPERLLRFFVKDEHGYRVRKEIREMVVFVAQDIILDPPFTKLDILSCRNLLIYLTPEIQKKLIPLFHYSLRSGGILFLGSAETIGGFTDLFTPFDGKSRLFLKKGSSCRSDPVQFPSSFSTGPAPISLIPSVSKTSSGLQSFADQLILQRYAPPSVLANEKGDILYISGKTGKYLEPAAGKANWNVFAMAREGLRYELTNAFQRAIRQNECILLRDLKTETNGVAQNVDVSVQRIDDPPPLQGLVMITFTDRAPPVKHLSAIPKTHIGQSKLGELEQELAQVRAEARSNREEMQTSQEELRSANEELQSTNEELQSTNEELTTSKEEMQSMNEELQTLNTELQIKLDELSQAGSDMKNLLDSTDIATLFLDKDLKVRRFTPLATKIIKLIPSDVGRPISDLTTTLQYPDLNTDAQKVLRTLVFLEKPIATIDDRWFSVRIMPYRTLDDRIDGLVLTFSDITESKNLEAKLRNRQSTLENHVAQQSSKAPRKKWTKT